MALPYGAIPKIYVASFSAIPVSDLYTPITYLTHQRNRTTAPSEQWKPGRVAGVTTVTGTPASQRVRVYRRSDGALVGETLSAEDGTYQVTGLDPEETHYVVALHTTLEYNAVVADNITPENPA